MAKMRVHADTTFKPSGFSPVDTPNEGQYVLVSLEIGEDYPQGVFVGFDPTREEGEVWVLETEEGEVFIPVDNIHRWYSDNWDNVEDENVEEQEKRPYEYAETMDELLRKVR